MKTTETFYGVELPSLMHPGQTRLALGAPGAGPGLRYWRKEAIAFKRRLVEEGFKKARVVKVSATYEWS
jgi:hypothetical protein